MATFLRSASAYNLASGSTNVQAVNATAGLLLKGFSIAESAGAAAVVYLRNGTATTDPIIAEIKLAANASQTVWLGDGVEAANGIFVHRSSGSVEGAVYYASTV